MSVPTAPVVFDRSLLIQHRKRCAGRAGIPDFLLARAAEDIVDRLSVIKRSFATVLNLGAGTSVLTQALADVPGIELVVEMDSTPQCLMGGSCPGVVGDEEALPFGAERFDLVVAGLTLQYVNDLPGALAQIRRILKPDGLFLGVMAGGDTLRELRQAALLAEEDVHGGASPRVAPFADVRDLGGLLQRAGFALPVADSDHVTVTYNTPLDLMRELKAMGASNVLADRRRVPMTRRLLLRIAERYAALFSEPDGRVGATFELLTMTGWAPHESQQQPLQPGSARTRLADALGTSEVSSGEQAGFVPDD